jgi:hypothetical protein
MKGPLDSPAAKGKGNPKAAQHTTIKSSPGKPAAAKPAQHAAQHPASAKPATGGAHPAGSLNPLDMPAPTHVVNPSAVNSGQAPVTPGVVGASPQGAGGRPASAQDVLNMRAPAVYTPSPALSLAQAQVATARQTCAEANDYAGYLNGLASNPDGMQQGINQMLQVLMDETTDPDRRAELQAAMSGAQPSDNVVQQLQRLAEAAQSICTAQTISSQKAMDAAQGVNSEGAPAPLAPPTADYSTPAPQQYPPQP